MYGWRARIGHICPSIPLDMILNEFQQMLPEGIQMVYSSLQVRYLEQEDFDRAVSLLEEAAEHMKEGEVDCVITGGGPVVTAKGSDVDVIEKVKAVTGVPSTSTMSAMQAALESLEAKRIVLASPYEDERNELLAAYLEKQGLTVAAKKGLGLRRAMDMAKLPFHASYRLAKEAVAMAPDADAIFMPCARVPVVGNIERIEMDTGIPVVTSVQSMLWWALETLDIGAPVDGFGTLLADR